MSGEGVVRNLLVVFGVKVNNLYQAERLQDGINSIEEGLRQMTAMATKAVVVLGALGGGIFAATKPIADLAVETDRFASAFGISVEKMQSMAFGMRAMGADADDLSDVLLQISEKARQVSMGSKEATQAFTDLGMSAAELKGLSPVQLFERMTEAFRGVTNQQTKFALASQLLGEDLAKKLLPTITAGGATLEDYGRIAQEAGAIMNRSQIETGKRVAMTYKKLGMVVQALKTRVGLELMPYVERLGNRMWDWYNANKAVIDSKIAEYAREIGDSMEWAQNTAKQMGALIQQLGGFESVMRKIGVVMATGLGFKLVMALVSMFSGMMTIAAAVSAKVLAVIAFLAITFGILGSAIVLVAEDMAVAQRGGESFIEFLRKHFDKLPLGFKVLGVALDVIANGFRLVGRWIRWMGDEFSYFFDVLRPALPYIIAGVLAAGAAFLAFLVAPLILLGTLVVFAIRTLIGLGKIITQVVTVASEAFGAMVDFIVAMFTDVIPGVFGEFLNFITDAIPRTIRGIIQGLSGMGTALFDELLGPFLEGMGDIGGAFTQEAAGLIGVKYVRERKAKGMAHENPSQGVAAPVRRYSGSWANEPPAVAGGKNGAGSKTVTVTAGDTVINVNGASDPAAVAQRVKAQQAMAWDNVLNSATNSAGGL